MANLPQRAALVSIGDELLRGDTVDSNKAFLAKELSGRGIAVAYGLTLPDDQEVIAAELQAILARFDVIFVGGGIGPTPDDVTRQAVAQAFGRQLLLDTAAVERYSAFTGKPLNDGQREMCRLPAGAELLWSEQSAAPAFRVDHVYVLPGVPQIMRWIWESIADRFRGAAWHSRRFRAACAESRFAAAMREFVARYPDLGFGSYPKLDDSGWWAEILVRGVDAEQVERVAGEFEQAIKELA